MKQQLPEGRREDLSDGGIRVYRPNGDIETCHEHPLWGYVLHSRGDEPAVLFRDGGKMWCWFGVPHRNGGHAIEHEDGTREWFHKGRRHRIDGPAVERPDGTVEYWLNGNQLSKEDFEKGLAERIEAARYAEEVENRVLWEGIEKEAEEMRQRNRMR